MLRACQDVGACRWVVRTDRHGESVASRRYVGFCTVRLEGAVRHLRCVVTKNRHASEMAVNNALEPLCGHPRHGTEGDGGACSSARRSSCAALLFRERSDAGDVVHVAERAHVSIIYGDPHACAPLGFAKRGRSRAVIGGFASVLLRSREVSVTRICNGTPTHIGTDPVGAGSWPAGGAASFFGDACAGAILVRVCVRSVLMLRGRRFVSGGAHVMWPRAWACCRAPDESGEAHAKSDHSHRHDFFRFVYSPRNVGFAAFALAENLSGRQPTDSSVASHTLARRISKERAPESEILEPNSAQLT